MLERILEKLGVNSLDEIIKKNNALNKKYKGYEIEVSNPFSVLNIDELNFLSDYAQKNNIRL